MSENEPQIDPQIEPQVQSVFKYVWGMHDEVKTECEKNDYRELSIEPFIAESGHVKSAKKHEVIEPCYWLVTGIQAVRFQVHIETVQSVATTNVFPLPVREIESFQYGSVAGN